MEEFDYELPKLTREMINQEVLEQVHQSGDFSSEGKAAALQQVLRENAIKQILDEGADMTKESIDAGVMSIMRSLDIPIIPTQSSQPPNERVIEPTSNPPGSIDLIHASPEPNQIQQEPSRVVYDKQQLDQMVSESVRREVDAQKDPLRTSAPMGKTNMDFERDGSGNIVRVTVTKLS